MRILPLLITVQRNLCPSSPLFLDNSSLPQLFATDSCNPHNAQPSKQRKSDQPHCQPCVPVRPNCRQLCSFYSILFATLRFASSLNSGSSEDNASSHNRTGSHLFQEPINKAISCSSDTSALYVSHTQRKRPQTPAASRAATISHTAETL